MPHLLLAALLLADMAPGSGPAPQLVSDAPSADLVVIGTVDGAPEMSVAEIYPPIYSYRFQLRDVRALKGVATPGATYTYAVRGDRHRPIRQGERVVLAIRQLHQNLGEVAVAHRVMSFRAAGAGVLQAVRGALATLTPLPASVSLSIRQVAPAKTIRWVNPFGDGRFEITLSNSGADVEVPEVVATGLFGRRVLVPARTLRRGETVTVTLDALTLPWSQRPGGGRLEVTVQTGDRSVSSFFYFHAQHHGPMMRARVR